MTFTPEEKRTQLHNCIESLLEFIRDMECPIVSYHLHCAYNALEQDSDKYVIEHPYQLR